MNFICVNWGLKFKPLYVQNLYNMVQRHLTIPHKFILFTDRIKLHKTITGDNFEIRKLPFEEYKGYWQKLTLFSPEANLKGPCLYMDLDVVIMKNIDDMFTYGKDHNFVGMNDFNPTTGQFNSSIMKFNNNTTSDLIWKEYMKRRGDFRKHAGDQNIITDLIKKHKDTISFPDSWTQSYKWFNREGKRYHKSKWTFEKDPNAKVCIFHGHPNPHDSDQEWVKNLWF